jgi:hypothetical protein
VNDSKDGNAMTIQSSSNDQEAHEGRSSRESLWWGASAAVRDAWVLRVILWVAISAELLALAIPFGPVVRLAIGATALLPLMWVPPQIERLYLAREELPTQNRVRRFLRLRTLTEVVLAEIRRLNWLGFDARRGARDRTAAELEMAAIELRLKSLISEIREAAGVEAQGAEALATDVLRESDGMITLELGTTLN